MWGRFLLSWRNKLGSSAAKLASLRGKTFWGDGGKGYAKAIRVYFPKCTQWMCFFHLMQAVWCRRKDFPRVYALVVETLRRNPISRCRRAWASTLPRSGGCMAPHFGRVTNACKQLRRVTNSFSKKCMDNTGVTNAINIFFGPS